MERLARDPTQAQRLAVNVCLLLSHRRHGGRILSMDKAPWPRPVRTRKSRLAGESPVYHISELSADIVVLASFSDDEGNEVMGPMPVRLQSAPEEHLVTWFVRKTLGDLW